MSAVTLVNDRDPIIIIDDNEADILIAKRCYAKSALTNPLITFDSGEAFLDYMNQVDADQTDMPGVALLDINMPGMDGFETLVEVRKNEKFRHVPVIMMLTNSDNPRDIERAEQLGANGYQTKPTGVAEYVEFFNSLMGRTEVTRAGSGA